MLFWQGVSSSCLWQLSSVLSNISWAMTIFFAHAFSPNVEICTTWQVIAIWREIVHSYSLLSACQHNAYGAEVWACSRYPSVYVLQYQNMRNDKFKELREELRDSSKWVLSFSVQSLAMDPSQSLMPVYKSLLSILLKLMLRKWANAQYDLGL